MNVSLLLLIKNETCWRLNTEDPIVRWREKQPANKLAGIVSPLNYLFIFNNISVQQKIKQSLTLGRQTPK